MPTPYLVLLNDVNDSTPAGDGVPIKGVHQALKILLYSVHDEIY
jgi:hypothetical protein